MNEKYLLKGKNAIVTGGSRGIGSGIAKILASEGCNVAIIYKSHEDDAKKIVKEIELKNGKANIFKCDISKEKQVNEVVEEILKNYKKIDILVNNAGIMMNGDIFSMKINIFKKIMETNLYSIIYFVKSLSENFKKYGGNIVNIASNSGLGTALDGYTYYSVSKAAVIALTKRLAYDFRNYNVRVNAVAPGTIDTDLMRIGKTKDEIEKIYSSRAEHTILKRVGNVNEIASVVLFLVSDLASFITGQTIVVDGGRFDYLSHGI